MRFSRLGAAPAGDCGGLFGGQSRTPVLKESWLPPLVGVGKVNADRMCRRVRKMLFGIIVD